jgi:hypothetical protein
MKASPAPDVKTKANIPVVDLERIERTYAELKKMEIRLDPNPIEYGPKRFNHRIAQVRAMLTRLEQIFLQTSEDLHYFKRIISKRTALYELEKRDLMINDPKCRVGRSQGEREALADVQLRSDIEILQKHQLAAQDLEALMVVIKSKRTDLKDIQGRMREQIKMIEHDLGMGGRWGNSTPPSPSLASQSVTEIDSLLADVDNSMGVTDDGTGGILEGGESEEDGEEDGEEEEGEEEEGEELVEGEEEDGEVEDSGDDPAPQGEAAPVLVFGEEDTEPEPEAEPVSEIEIHDEEGEGNLPEKHAEQDDADSFLDSLDAALDGETVEDSEVGSEQGIDDLIASLSED